VCALRAEPSHGTRLEPLRFERHFLESLGGRTLERRQASQPPGKIGET
jgi:hypothetical protein